MQRITKRILVFAKRKPKLFLAAVATVISLYIGLLLYQVCCWTPGQAQLSHHLWGEDLYQRNHPVDPRLRRQAHLNQTCSERRNFVFVKGMKCATSTLLGMFYRFGYTRNLSFVSPLGQRIYLNWPYKMTLRDFRPSSRGYNILTDHSIYTEDVMESIMPPDTVYISIVRQPVAQLKSVFQYFKLAKLAGIPENTSDPVAEYFSNLQKYEMAYQAPGNKERWCIPDGFSLTKNLMSHCHGMPLGFPLGTNDISNNISAVQHYIQHLDSKFSLIMIVEYFYESIILLRRMMCWTFKDIVFVNSNVADYRHKKSPLPKEIQELHRNWSNADYMLYDYFNRTFWKHISRQSSDFFMEVEAFKLVETRVQNYCRKLYNSFKEEEYPVNMTSIVIGKSLWNQRFSITWKDCWMLGPNPYKLIHVVQKENDEREAILLKEQMKDNDNRIAKGTC